MAADKSLFSRLFSKDNQHLENDVEIKALQERLDTVIGEQWDSSMYDVKFIDSDNSNFSNGYPADFSGIDQQIDMAALQRVYSTETWVYVAVNAIAKTIAGLPYRLERRKEFSKTVFNDLTGQPEKVTQEMWIDASGEKLNKLFQNPNPHSTRAEFLMLITIDLLTTGNFYVYLDSDQDLTVIADSHVDDDANSPFGRLRTMMSANTKIDGMYRIPPPLIKAIPSEDKIDIAGYMLQTQAGSFAFNKAEVVQVKLPNPIDPFLGLSPLVAGFKPVLLDRFSTEHMIRFYKSGARLGGIIHTEKSLNKEQLGKFQRSFENNFTGRQNHHRTLILPPGMKYEQVEQNPAETALLEFCKYNREAILSVYGVPPIKAGILDNANYANAKAQLENFFTDSIIPYLNFIQDGFNHQAAMIPDNSTYRIQFDLSQVKALQEDIKEQSDVAKTMLDAGFTLNEVREKIWKKGPIEGGNESPVVVRMRKDSGMGLNELGAIGPEADQTTVVANTPDPNALAANQITDPTLSLNGAQVTAMMSIVQQVAQGFLPRPSGIEMIIASFSVPREAAERIMGEVGKTFSISPQKPIEDPQQPTLPALSEPQSVDAPGLNEGGKSEQKEALPNVQADTALLSDITPTDCTFSERVSQLVQVFVEGGVPLNIAIPKAIEQARLEGFKDPDGDGPDTDGPSGAPKPTDGEGQAPKDEEGKDLTTVDQSALIPVAIGNGKPMKDRPCDVCGKVGCDCDKNNKDGDGKPSFAVFLSDEIAKLADSSDVTPDVIQEIKNRYNTLDTPVQKEVSYPNGFTKDHIVSHWKGFIEKTDPLVEKRHKELKEFFAKFKRIVMSRFGADLKAYGMHKARNSDDADEIMEAKAFQALLAEQIKDTDKKLLEAMEQGYGATLDTFDFGPASPAALEALKKFALKSATSVNDTTIDQLKSLLVDMFESGKSVTEIGAAISDKFEEISTGRAMTIARTETLTAVSLGKAAKRTEWQERFPEKKLSKMWVTAQDERVRDSHQELEGAVAAADEPFANGLFYPRDPGSDDASEVINCRCDVIDFAAEDQALIADNSSEDDSNEER